MKKKDSPFFCYKKNCRKTAWNTPEYLSPEDWAFLDKVVDILEHKDGDTLFEFLWEDYQMGIRFFNHMIGWTEGDVYCRERRYVVITAFPGLVRHDLPKMKQALTSHNESAIMIT